MKLETLGEMERQGRGEEQGPWALLLLLLRGRSFLLRFTLAAAVLSCILVLVERSRYTAETVLLPPMGGSPTSAAMSQLGGSGALASLAGAGMGLKNPGEMYVALLHSRTVEDAMIQRFGLMDRYHAKTMVDARLQLEKKSSIVLGLKDGLIRLTVEDWDPKLAAQMANAWVEEFRKLTAGLAVTEASQRRLFFQQQLVEVKGRLAEAEEALRSTQSSTGMLQVEGQARLTMESAAALRAQVVAKQVQIDSMRSYAADDNPELQLAWQQLAALKTQLAKLAGSEPDATSDLALPRGKMPAAGMEYLRRLRDVKYYETISELIGRQYEAAKLDEARQGAVVQVADVAVPPDKRSFPKRTITVVLLTIAAFIAACLWLVAKARLAQPEQAARLAALRAAWPKTPDRA